MTENEIALKKHKEYSECCKTSKLAVIIGFPNWLKEQDKPKDPLEDKFKEFFEYNVKSDKEYYLVYFEKLKKIFKDDFNGTTKAKEVLDIIRNKVMTMCLAKNPAHLAQTILNMISDEKQRLESESLPK